MPELCGDGNVLLLERMDLARLACVNFPVRESGMLFLILAAVIV